MNGQPSRLVRKLLADLDSDGLSMPLLRFMINHFDSYADHLFMIKQIMAVTLMDVGSVGRDAWSEGQLRSKHWLLENLAKLDRDLGETWIACGWIGSLALMMDCYRPGLRFTRLRSFDVDDRCAELADALNKRLLLDDWRFKASTADVHGLCYDDNLWYTNKSQGRSERMFGSADTIINTSCEHLADFDLWFGGIPDGKLVVLQCSDHDTYDGHVNHMDSMTELAMRARCRRIMYKGTLDCGQYQRHMLIGVK
jgi:hypothetical protein